MDFNLRNDSRPPRNLYSTSLVHTGLLAEMIRGPYAPLRKPRNASCTISQLGLYS